MLEGLLKSGFLDDGMQIHGWEEHNSYHTAFSERAKAANDARWEKHRAKKERDRDKDNDKDIDKEGRSPQGVLVGSLKDKPTIDEVLAECSSRDVLNSTGTEFWHYYESNGWMVGKNKMKVWKSALTGWIQRNANKASTTKNAVQLRREHQASREFKENIVVKDI